MDDLTQSELKRVLYYCVTTGDFFWRFGTRNRLPWRRAGTPTKAGYLVINIRGQLFYAHRLALLYMDGAMPAQHTDHKNGVRHTNTYANLRDASFTANGLNRQAANTNSTSGILGVTKRKNRFRARVMVSRKEHFLGSFNTADAASAAVALFRSETLHHCATSAEGFGDVDESEL